MNTLGIGHNMEPITIKEACMSEFNGFSKEVTAKGYKVDGKHYKRVPSGYDDAHPNAALEYWRIDFFSITPTLQS